MLIQNSSETTIFRWLEETYPDRPSIFQPDQALPIDSNSDTHAQAIKDCVEWPLSPLGYGPMFTWFAPRFAPNFTEEDRTYWTSEARMGPGRFKAMCDADGGEFKFRVPSSRSRARARSRTGAPQHAKLTCHTSCLHPHPHHPRRRRRRRLGR